MPFFGAIITPTRELALQISDYLKALGSQIFLKTCVLIGGLDSMQQVIALAQKPHISISRSFNLIF